MQTQPSPLRRKYSSASLPGGPAPPYCRDVDASEPNLDQYLERVAGIDRSDRSSHLARAAILEQATILDYALNELVALPLAVDQAAANLLAFDILARIPNDVRVGMLETLMKDHDLEDSWPFVIPVVRKVFGLRNRLAHGFVERVANDRIQITSYNLSGKDLILILGDQLSPSMSSLKQGDKAGDVVLMADVDEDTHAKAEVWLATNGNAKDAQKLAQMADRLRAKINTTETKEESKS